MNNRGITPTAEDERATKVFQSMRLLGKGCLRFRRLTETAGSFPQIREAFRKLEANGFLIAADGGE